MVVAREPDPQFLPVDEDYLDDIAQAFGQVIDAKSPYTGGHSERVGRYADAVAARIGVPAGERRALRRAAMLHDVGKLSVSCRVLEKPGKLDADEWEVMRSHALQTTEILKRIGPFRGLSLIAGSHHERLDGRGYRCFGLGLFAVQRPFAGIAGDQFEMGGLGFCAGFHGRAPSSMSRA